MLSGGSLLSLEVRLLGPGGTPLSLEVRIVDPGGSPLSLEVKYWKVDKKATIKN